MNMRNIMYWVFPAVICALVLFVAYSGNEKTSTTNKAIGASGNQNPQTEPVRPSDSEHIAQKKLNDAKSKRDLNDVDGAIKILREIEGMKRVPKEILDPAMELLVELIIPELPSDKKHQWMKAIECLNVGKEFIEAEAKTIETKKVHLMQNKHLDVFSPDPRLDYRLETDSLTNAIQFADDILKKEGNFAPALIIKAHSQTLLKDYEDAQKTYERLQQVSEILKLPISPSLSAATKEYFSVKAKAAADARLTKLVVGHWTRDRVVTVPDNVKINDVEVKADGSLLMLASPTLGAGQENGKWVVKDRRLIVSFESPKSSTHLSISLALASNGHFARGWTTDGEYWEYWAQKP